MFQIAYQLLVIFIRLPSEYLFTSCLFQLPTTPGRMLFFVFTVADPQSRSTIVNRTPQQPRFRTFPFTTPFYVHIKPINREKTHTNHTPSMTDTQTPPRPLRKTLAFVSAYQDSSKENAIEENGSIRIQIQIQIFALLTVAHNPEIYSAAAPVHSTIPNLVPS